MVAPEKGERLWNLQFWGLEFLILHLLILFMSFRGWMKSWLSNCTLKGARDLGDGSADILGMEGRVPGKKAR